MSGVAIPDNEVTMDAPATAAQGTGVPSAGAQGTLQTAIPDEEVQLDSDKYSSPLQQAGTAAEGFAKGLAGPLATGAELGLSKLGVPGLSAEEQEARKQTNPATAGLSEAAGFGTGLFTGTGEAGLLAHLGEGAAGLAGLGEATTTGSKVGSAALKGLIETAGFQAGDEASKAMLNENDPETPVASALANTGFAGLMGAGIGGGLGLAGIGAAKGLRALADTQLGQKAAQTLEDFGSRWKFRQTNPDLADTVTGELSKLYNDTSSAADNDFGTVQLKDDAIQKLAPPMNDAIKNQTQSISDKLNSTVADMIKDPDSYPPRLAKKIQAYAQAWTESATDPNASSFDVFKNTEDLKQKFQFDAKYEKQINPLAPEGPYIQAVKGLAYDMRKSLEDPNVWGQAGDLQKESNAAYSNLIKKDGPLKTFEGKFVGNTGQGWVVNPGAVNTYMNQLGKPSAALKPEVVSNFIKASEQYRNQIEKLHAIHGLDSPFTPTSLDAVNSTLNKSPSSGAQWADKAFDGGVAGFTTKLSSGTGLTVGAAEGYREGGLKGALVGGAAGVALPYVEKALQRRITQKTIPWVLDVLSKGHPEAMAAALEHAQNIHRGSSAIENAVNSLFTGSKLGAQEAFAASAQDKDKIKKFVEKGGVIQQIQNSIHNQNKTTTPYPTPQAFAEGGTVQSVSQPIQQPSQEQPPPNHFASAYPEQNVVMNMAKGRVYNYLNGLRPQENPSKLPFDNDPPADKTKAKSYDTALTLAAKPLNILNSVKEGTLTPGELNHFKQLWPEVHNHLSKKITERLSQGQINGEKPSYKVRQSISMFLSAPMDSSMTPQSAQAVQAVFAQAKAQQQASAPPAKAKKGSSALNKVSDSYETGDQSRQQRQQKA